MLTVVSGWLMPLALGMSPRGKRTQCADGGHPGTDPHADGIIFRIRNPGTKTQTDSVNSYTQKR